MAYEKTLLSWLVKDDKALIESLDMDVFSISCALDREPISVLRRLKEDRAATALEKLGLAFNYESGSEEEAEFFGLALAGMPVSKALMWCLGHQDRPSREEMSELMPFGDCRPALYMARQTGIWFSRADEIETLCSLEESMPEEIIQEAVIEILGRFDAPTPDLVQRCVHGEAPAKERPYKWYVEGQNSGCAPRTYASRARKKQSSRGRSFGKRSYSGSTWGRRKKYAGA